MEENQNINVNEEVETVEETTKEVTYTQADFDRMISQTYEKMAKKFEKKMAQQQSLSGLDEQDRKLKEAEIKAQELEEKLKAYELLEQKQEVTKVLNARGLSVEFVDYLNLTDDAVANQQMIDKLDKLFKAQVKAEVEKRIGSNTPKNSTVGLDGSITKEQFKKMSLAEQSALYENNKELYQTLTK